MTEEMQKYDLNGDGVLDPEERELMLEDRRAEMLDDADANETNVVHIYGSCKRDAYVPVLVVATECLDFQSKSEILADMATIYSRIIFGPGAYFGSTQSGEAKAE
jgi:hypothetical protein